MFLDDIIFEHKQKNFFQKALEPYKKVYQNDSQALALLDRVEKDFINVQEEYASLPVEEKAKRFSSAVQGYQNGDLCEIFNEFSRGHMFINSDSKTFELRYKGTLANPEPPPPRTISPQNLASVCFHMKLLTHFTKQIPIVKKKKLYRYVSIDFFKELIRQNTQTLLSHFTPKKLQKMENMLIIWEVMHRDVEASPLSKKLHQLIVYKTKTDCGYTNVPDDEINDFVSNFLKKLNPILPSLKFRESGMTSMTTRKDKVDLNDKRRCIRLILTLNDLRAIEVNDFSNTIFHEKEYLAGKNTTQTFNKITINGDMLEFSGVIEKAKKFKSNSL